MNARSRFELLNLMSKIRVRMRIRHKLNVRRYPDILHLLSNVVVACHTTLLVLHSQPTVGFRSSLRDDDERSILHFISTPPC
jgi:hypothetical protein